MKLIQNGQPQYGIVDTPWTEINYLDVNHISPLGKVIGSRGKHKAYKHFQYLGVISPSLVFGCAMVHTSIGNVLFVYIYHTQSKQLKEWSFKDIGSFCSSSVTTPTQGCSHFKRGNTSIEYINQNQPREKRLIVRISDELNLDVYFSETIPTFQPMCLTTKAGYNGWVYAQKSAGIQCKGHITCEFGHFNMEDINACAHHDWSGGFMRRETAWEWACLSGIAGGKRVGLNVSCGVNETSFTENCYWVDGTLFKIDSVTFEYERQNPKSVWRIRSFDDQIDLYFHPEGFHREKLNLFFFASNFKQFFGQFNGRIGNIKIQNQYGFVEDQYAKW